MKDKRTLPAVEVEGIDPDEKPVYRLVISALMMHALVNSETSGGAVGLADIAVEHADALLKKLGM